MESDGARRAIRIFSRKGAPVVAVNDGRITRLGHNRRLGRFVELQDTYGNTYLYSGLGEVAKIFPFPKQRKVRKRDLALPEAGVAPKRAASRTRKADVAAARAGKTRSRTIGRRKPTPPPRSRSAWPRSERRAARGRARQGAPVRQPAPPRRQGRRRRRRARHGASRTSTA